MLPSLTETFFSVWAKSELQDKLKYILNLTSTLTVVSILSANGQTALAHVIARRWNKMQRKPFLISGAESSSLTV